MKYIALCSTDDSSRRNTFLVIDVCKEWIDLCEQAYRLLLTTELFDTVKLKPSLIDSYREYFDFKECISGTTLDKFEELFGLDLYDETFIPYTEEMDKVLESSDRYLTTTIEIDNNFMTFSLWDRGSQTWCGVNIAKLNNLTL